MMPVARMLGAGILSTVLTLPAADMPQVALDPEGPARVLAFLGDSLTEGGGYHQRLQLYLSTRYPGSGHWVVNLGWNGDTAHGALGRLDAEAIPDEVDTVFIFFGMNDVSRDAYRNQAEPLSDDRRRGVRRRYETSLDALITRLNRDDRQLVLVSPTVFDDVGTAARGQPHEHPHLDAELAHFGQLARGIAQAQNLPWIDLHGPMRQLSDRQHAADAAFSLTVDRVHLNDAGNDVVFVSVLDAMGQKGPVWQLEVGLTPKAQVRTATGVRVLNVAGIDGGLELRLAERALPYPGWTETDTGLTLVDFATRFNQMLLQIHDLAPGEYRLLIDDVEITRQPAAAWAAGVDVALFDTPQQRLAITVRELVRRKATIDAIQRTLVKVRHALDRDGTAAGIDWTRPDADEIQARWATRADTAWNQRMAATIRREAPRWATLNQHRAEIRATLAALPRWREHRYQVLRVTDE